MRKLQIILIGLAVSLLLVNAGFYLARWMEPDNYWAVFVYACIFAPIWEEAVFRWAPIQIARKVGVFEQIKWPLIILTSVVFGLIHGGTLSILVQGTFGLILSAVYIETGFSYLSAVTLHSLWNMFIFFRLMGDG